jgi:glycosyltransferase involved in cell wall biosynthesis
MTSSAVVPVYNAAAYIRETLDSLLGQERALDEIIVIDDASTDNTCVIVEQVAALNPRVKLHRFSSNQGVSAARNFGIQAASGEWILFLDGDDIAAETLLARQLQRANELADEGYGKVILLHSAYQQIDEAGKKISGVTRWQQVSPKEVFGYFLLRNHIITTSGVLARREALLEAGGFNPELRYAEDWDLWLRLAQRGAFGYVDEPLVLVRRHRHNTSKSVTTGLEGEQRVLRQYSLAQIQTAIFRRELSWEVNAADYAAMLLRMEHWQESCRFLEQALERNPAFVTGHFLMGLYYLKQQNWTAARQSFEQTLAVDENHGAALNNLGALLAAAGKREEALQQLTRALELFPAFLDAKRNVALVSLPHDRIPGYDELHFTWRELRPVLLSYSE